MVTSHGVFSFGDETQAPSNPRADKEADSDNERVFIGHIPGTVKSQFVNIVLFRLFTSATSPGDIGYRYACIGISGIGGTLSDFDDQSPYMVRCWQTYTVPKIVQPARLIQARRSRVAMPC
jgi:hypothetical protein